MKNSFNKKTRLISEEKAIINSVTKMFNNDVFLSSLKIDERHRQIIRYKFVDKLSNDEIAVKLNVHKTSVKYVIISATNLVLKRTCQLAVEFRNLENSNNQYSETLKNIRSTVNNMVSNKKNKPEEPHVIHKTPQSEEELESIKMMDLPIGTRAKNSFKDGDLMTLKDIVSMKRKELERFRNLGKKSLNQVEEVLSRYGLKLQE